MKDKEFSCKIVYRNANFFSFDFQMNICFRKFKFQKISLIILAFLPLDGEKPPMSAGPPPPAPTYKGKYEADDHQDDEAPLFSGPVPEPPVIEVPDNGRQPDLPQCPIVFVAGWYFEIVITGVFHTNKWALFLFIHSDFWRMP